MYDIYVARKLIQFRNINMYSMNTQVVKQQTNKSTTILCQLLLPQLLPNRPPLPRRFYVVKHSIP